MAYLCVAFSTGKRRRPGREGSSGHYGVVGQGQDREVQPGIGWISLSNEVLKKKKLWLSKVRLSTDMLAGTGS